MERIVACFRRAGRVARALTLPLALLGPALVARPAVVEAVLVPTGGLRVLPGPPVASHLKYFGFTGVDCFFDDPRDGVQKSEYLDEVADFTNVAHFCVSDLDIAARLTQFNSQGVKPLISVESIFTNQVDGTMALRPNYLAQWQEFVSVNNLSTRIADIAGFYLPDEPLLNGLAYDSLKIIADTVKASLPTVPILLIEADAKLGELQIPDSVDWVGFDQYGIVDPTTDQRYLDNYQILKTKIGARPMKVMLVLDTQWRELYLSENGISEDDMALVASNYVKFANADTNVIGIMGYLWPGGLDAPDQKGARELPAAVIEFYKRLGRTISGK